MHVAPEKKFILVKSPAKKNIFSILRVYLQTMIQYFFLFLVLQVAINYSSLDLKLMQRCPYIHEMKERLLGPQRADTLAMESFDRERDNLLENSGRPGTNQVGTVATVVKVRVGSLQTPEKIQVIQTFLMISFDYFKRKTFCSLVSRVESTQKITFHCFRCWMFF